jgi:hypothetical protein
MIPFFQGGYDEAKLYTHGSNKKIYPKCPVCGKVKNKPMMIAEIYATNSIGCTCSDGISYPEKFITCILDQLKVVYVYQLTKRQESWCKNYIYDFSYIEKSCIIETHGKQHYEDTNFRGNKIKYKQQQENDRAKEQLAKINGIKHYIALDCRYSELEWIKKSVMESELPTLFNFKEDDIDWLKCHEFALYSLVKIACDYKRNNQNMTTTQIGVILHLTKPTIRRYLKQGNELGWCHYDAEEEFQKVLHRGDK